MKKLLTFLQFLSIIFLGPMIIFGLFSFVYILNFIYYCESLTLLGKCVFGFAFVSLSLNYSKTKQKDDE